MPTLDQLIAYVQDWRFVAIILVAVCGILNRGYAYERGLWEGLYDADAALEVLRKRHRIYANIRSIGHAREIYRKSRGGKK